MKTALLEKLYRKYNIYNLGFGIIHDKLGDVYEEYCVQILNSPSYFGIVKKCAVEENPKSEIDRYQAA